MRTFFLAQLVDAETIQHFLDICLSVLRYLFPLLALWILLRCIRSLLSFRREPEIWAWLNIRDETLLPVTHWENAIGSGKHCDIVIPDASVWKNHAVLTRYDDGSWTVSDIGGRGGVQVGGEAAHIRALEYGEHFSVGEVDMTLEPVTQEDKQQGVLDRTQAGRLVYPGPTLVILTLFQIFAALVLVLRVERADIWLVGASFGVLIVLQWALFLGQKAARRSGYEVETIAFFLTTLGLCVIASKYPAELLKQTAAICISLLLYLVLGWSLRDLERAKKLRYGATVIGIALLAGTLVLGTSVYGAKNWIFIAGYSFQPAELAKLCFVFVGASSLDRLTTKRNLILFILYSAIVCALLALMNDFGTALVFFVAFLIIAFLRSGSFATLALSLAATGFAGSLALTIRPHIKKRFAVWGHVWEDALDKGYQQTRSLMCIASGGLFGLGAGCGWLKYVAASDTDLVFAFLGEEWGLLIALMTVVCVAVLCFFVVRTAGMARSSFYTIGACAAATILLIQVILNVFGTLDFLPLTGVTFPFVSNGGSSMLASWGLLAFIKAADTRQNASFAVRLSREADV